MSGVPLLLISDAVDAHSGLSRITRDIAMHASRMPEFRVGTMGKGGRGTRKTPWPQYVIGDSDWGESYLNEVWRDFAGNERGVVMTVWDASRVRYLVDPSASPRPLREFLSEGRFAKWAYVPVDATGPNNLMSGVLTDTISKFDRVLAYGMWSRDLIERSLSSIGRTHPDLDWLPHGINFKAFSIRDRVAARMAINMPNELELAAVVMTNQQRKDWGTVAMMAQELKRRRPQLRWWWHVDTEIRHWNIHALIQDYGLGDIVSLTASGEFSDVEMSWRYSASNVVVMPSSEGYGYPIAEANACGVPVVHSTYAGGAELIQQRELKVEPMAYRMEGIYNSLRPVWNPQDWVEAVGAVLDQEWDREELRRNVAHLDWTNMRGPWESWLRKGVGL